MEIYLASAEDTILAKLDWYRQGGWAGRLNLTDLFKRALEDAGLPPDS